MITDVIGDMLTRIRNANEAEHEIVSIPFSRLKLSIVDILKAEGFIHGFHVDGDGPAKAIKVNLKYQSDGGKVIHNIERVSKPGRRVYVAKKSIPKVLNGLGVSIFTTSKGVMTGYKARVLNQGGEYICRIW